MIARIAVALLLAAACTDAPPQRAATETQPAPAPPDDRPRLLPVDRAAEEPGFADYRKRLMAVVAARDTAALEALVDPNVRTSFGAEGGWAELRRQWKLPSKESPLWDELATILRLGGSFRATPGMRMFCAPYVYSDWPEEVDAWSHLAVIGSRVPLRLSPSDGAPVVAEMDHHLVRVIDGDPSAPWRHVELDERTRGWVRSDQARSHLDYRACFTRDDGTWKMALLVAGD